MHARVTLLEIDTVRVDVGSAIGLFEKQVLPALRDLDGYRGVYVLATAEGKGLLLSLWDREDQADAATDRGFYHETLERYMTLFRSPPGREHYEVAFADLPPRPAAPAPG